MAPVLTKLGITCLPFFGLARGFLSGKYKAGVTVDSVRAGGVKDYQNEVGWKVIAQLEEIALVHEASVGAVALAWLRSQETVSVPIASARTVAQLTQIMAVVELSSREIDDLSAITSY
jgi:aryl-alcohol dehydrogenase-like predicted oxidoreductase